MKPGLYVFVKNAKTGIDEIVSLRKAKAMAWDEMVKTKRKGKLKI